VIFAISDDGSTFRDLETVKPESTAGPRDITITRPACRKAVDGRYVRIRATNAGPRPAWGSTEMITSFIFCDEIQIERH